MPELAIPDSVENDISSGVDGDETVIGIQELNVLDLVFGSSGQDLMSIADEIGNDDVSVLAPGGQVLAAFFNVDRVAPQLMLLHVVPA